MHFSGLFANAAVFLWAVIAACSAVDMPAPNAERLAPGLGPMRPRMLYEPATPVEMAKRANPSSTIYCPSPYYRAVCCNAVGTKTTKPDETNAALGQYPQYGYLVGPDTPLGLSCFSIARLLYYPEISGIARCCNTVTTNGELAIDCIQVP